MRVTRKFLYFLQRYPKQVDAAILILGFTVGANLYIFLKFSGLNERNITFLLEKHGFHWIIPTLAGIVIGTGFAVLEFRLFQILTTRINRLKLFLLKIFTFSLVIVASAVLVHISVAVLVRENDLSLAFEKTRLFIRSDIFFSLYIYLMLLGAALNFFRALGNRFGHGIIFNYLLGKYRMPIEEDRTFMFLDLNNSTGIAERLGHVKYSRFLHNCFNDLNQVLQKYDAQIYQYVGDEVVLTWRNEDVSKKRKMLDLFFEFDHMLKNKKKEYLEKFHEVPGFKASVNSGVVTVSEVGRRRKDIAYHGDVLNTAARLLGLCKQYQQKIIITDSFLKLIKHQISFSPKYLTTLKLRGKTNSVSVYGIVKMA